MRCRITTANLFGLYRHQDIDHMTNQSTHENPQLPIWLKINTIVVEDIQVQQEMLSKRFLSIQLDEELPKLSKEMSELF